LFYTLYNLAISFYLGHLIVCCIVPSPVQLFLLYQGGYKSHVFRKSCLCYKYATTKVS